MSSIHKILNHLKIYNQQRLKNRPPKHARGKTGEEARRIAVELEIILKNTTGIPVLVVSYNNFCHVAQMVDRLNKRSIKPIIIDNASTDSATKAALKAIASEGKSSVIFSRKNFNHMVGFVEPIYEKLPNFFAYTDPDLQISDDLPDDFLQILANLSEEFHVYKAGFAMPLELENHKLSDKRNSVNSRNPFRFHAQPSITEWESKYWKQKIQHSLEVYSAPVDTTFAVYNKSKYRGLFYDAVRVAGKFSAIHLPWFEDLDPMTAEDKATYMRNNQSTSWK